MAIVKTIPRQGNVTVNPINGQITYAGSKGFNESMANGNASKIWFQVPNPSGGDDCFLSYDVEKDEFNPSMKVINRYKLSDDVVAKARAYGENVRKIAELKALILSYPHGE